MVFLLSLRMGSLVSLRGALAALLCLLLVQLGGHAQAKNLGSTPKLRASAAQGAPAKSASRGTQAARKPQATRTKKARPAPPAPAPLRDGQAEERLLQVLELTRQGQTRDALTQAERLVRDYPNFQLAQLALGDLLAARARPLQQPGDVPSALHAEARTTLLELRTELQRRVEARGARPGQQKVPSQFLELAPRYRHAIAVDASRSRLYLFENTPQGLRLVADYYASVGKLGIEKTVEGDQRTPLGVYFITSRLDPATLRDFYGAGALPLNYPNPLDQLRGKTGSGIWLHGTPPDQFSRAPQATDGCVALANPDLERLLRTVEPRTTPVVIARQLDWVAPHSVQAEHKAFEAVLDGWRNAKTAGDMQRLMAFYAPDFQGQRKTTLAQWATALHAETQALGGREIELKDKAILRWTDSMDTMVVTFGEVASGSRTGPVKRQFWARRGKHWQIIYEGVIG
ncbi:L,D-transpeptidase family protein [Simplicispira sedimenti]|uniref:L,D-transpeptidase family protein n=1 Tax=Simplicispira sedimenti TaxID=2919500 RepID=UPI001FAA8CF5|nr:L,D-transpeptidase family protein [Acidovorax sp. W1-6]